LTLTSEGIDKRAYQSKVATGAEAKDGAAGQDDLDRQRLLERTDRQQAALFANRLLWSWLELAFAVVESLGRNAYGATEGDHRELSGSKTLKPIDPDLADRGARTRQSSYGVRRDRPPQLVGDPCKVFTPSST
jgi:hypothetical protein